MAKRCRAKKQTGSNSLDKKTWLVNIMCFFRLFAWLSMLETCCIIMLYYS
jgi:hypothetical protein